jgi:hypothetical protein
MFVACSWKSDCGGGTYGDEMAELVTPVSDGKLLWYGLGPADLAVHALSEPSRGITLSWKGEMEPADLRHSFENVAISVSKYHHDENRVWRAWVVTDDGPQVMKDSEDDYLISSSEFVQFESLPKAPTRDDELGDPVVAVFSNQDRRASSPKEAQDSVGLFLKNAADIVFLRSEIASMVAQTKSRFFKDGSYSRERVLKRLEEVSADLKIAHPAF